MIENFADAIQRRAPLIAPAREGLASLEIINAVLWSSWTGAPADLPIDAEKYASALQKKIAASAFRKPSATKANIDMAKSYR